MNEVAVANDSPGIVRPSFGHRICRQRRSLVIVFVASFALDFKGATGGGVIQALMAGLNLIAFVFLAISYHLILPRRGLGAFVLWGWVIFLLTGSIGALVNSVPFGHYIRVIYPFALFLEGFLVAWWVARSPGNARALVSVMAVIAVVSMVFTFWWGFHFTGESTERIRYQILSPLLPLLIIMASYALFFACQRMLWSLMLLFASFGIIALSVTRGEILMVGLVAVIVMMAMFVNFIRSGSIPRPFLRAVSWALVLGVFGIIVMYVSNHDILARWLHRSLGSKSEVTFWTRIAAVIGQYQALNSGSFGWLIGQGFGSSYSWPLYLFPWILKYMLAASTIGRTVWYPGEFMWMPFFYYGGGIIGALAALLLLACAVHAFRLTIMLLRMQSWRIPQTRPLWIGILGYFVFLGMGFSANPFILRLAAMFMGLCLGLVMAQGPVVLFISSTRSMLYKSLGNLDNR